jgi:hypothetical protein
VEREEGGVRVGKSANLMRLLRTNAWMGIAFSSRTSEEEEEEEWSIV